MSPVLRPERRSFPKWIWRTPGSHRPGASLQGPRSRFPVMTYSRRGQMAFRSLPISVHAGRAQPQAAPLPKAWLLLTGAFGLVPPPRGDTLRTCVPMTVTPNALSNSAIPSLKYPHPDQPRLGTPVPQRPLMPPTIVSCRSAARPASAFPAGFNQNACPFLKVASGWPYGVRWSPAPPRDACPSSRTPGRHLPPSRPSKRCPGSNESANAAGKDWD